MSDYLNQLVARSRGQTPGLQPRRLGRFEPPSPTAGWTPISEGPAFPEIEPPAQANPPGSPSPVSIAQSIEALTPPTTSALPSPVGPATATRLPTPRTWALKPAGAIPITGARDHANASEATFHPDSALRSPASAEPALAAKTSPAERTTHPAPVPPVVSPKPLPNPTPAQITGLARQIAEDVLARMQPDAPRRGKVASEQSEPAVVEPRVERLAAAPVSPSPAPARPNTTPKAIRPVPQRLRPVIQRVFSSTRASEPAAPTVHVTIGRVEVTAVVPAPAVTVPRPTAGPKLTLEAYLNARDGGAR